MKKAMLVVIAMLVIVGVAMAQPSGPTYAAGVTGKPITGIDKLGAHQNGGRGCVGCHAPHSGARGNGGVMRWNPTGGAGGTGAYESVAVEGVVGDEVLWGQDLGPIYTATLDFPSGDLNITETSPERLITGVAMCLSCHDGNVAKGAMMTNQSFEQAAGLLPASYGTQPIPTLLGADGGSYGNYKNDHPVGPLANLGSLSGINNAKGFFAFDAGKTKLVKGPSFTGSAMETFANNYGLPLTVGARTGAGFAVETTMGTIDEAYVVCTTCHTPHTMYTASASSTNPIATKTSGVYPSFFFVAAPYNPSADTSGGKASSATQFCRQCHFTGAGGSNEGSGISVPTAF